MLRELADRTGCQGEIGLVNDQDTRDLQYSGLDGLDVITEARGVHDNPYIRYLDNFDL